MNELMRKHRTASAIILLIAAAVICFPVASWLSKPDIYQGIFRVIDAKIANVLSLSAACTVISTGITVLKDDIATPIATQLAEYTDYLLVIISILLTEKYMLTILAWITCRIMVPGYLIFLIPSVADAFPVFRVAVVKLAALFVALYAVIPASVGLTNMITATYDLSFEDTIAEATQMFSPQTEGAGEDVSLWEKMTDTVTGLADTITQLPSRAAALVNKLIQAIAVMLVTSLLIPILTLLLALGIVKVTTGQIVPVRIGGRKHETLPNGRSRLSEKERVPGDRD